MIRSEILREIAPILNPHLVVCNIGLPSQELHMIDDNERNFYMLGTMGLSSSIGLGLALAQEKTVISIDGDGSVLTNLGTLHRPQVLGNQRPVFARLENRDLVTHPSISCFSPGPSRCMIRTNSAVIPGSDRA